MLGFFKGTNEKLSMMRLLCFITIIGCLPALYLAITKEQSVAEICLLMGTALAGKWLQRKAE